MGFDVRDVEYTSKYRGSIRRGLEGGNKRWLRNRTVLTAKW